MGNVLKVVVENNNDEIKFSGTTENEVLAVSCSLRDKDEKEIGFNSVVVDDNEFTGTFQASLDAVSVACANYDGGKIVSAIIPVKDEPKKDESKNEKDINNEIVTGTASDPDTGIFSSGDYGFAGIAISGVILLLALAGVFVFTRNRKKNKVSE